MERERAEGKFDKLRARGAGDEELMKAKMELEKLYEGKRPPGGKGEADEVLMGGLKAKIGAKAAQEGLVSPIYIIDGVVYGPQTSALKQRRSRSLRRVSG